MTAPRAAGLEVNRMSKRFGALKALDDVSLKVRPGTFHGLLGENGAGKSTLVKCIMGYYAADEGEVLLDGREQEINSPREAQARGIGMVYQHFTVVPGMTVLENLVLARADVPAIVDWARERTRAEAFLARMPFKVPLDVAAKDLAAGERQKVEILKQLYLDQRFLILDEPTSVLTPGEADEILGLLKGMTEAGRLTVLIITHKFREVMGFADDVTVLRRGRLAGTARVADATPESLARLMVGEGATMNRVVERKASIGAARLVVAGLCAEDETGEAALREVAFQVRSGEIVGVAGVSGNGQRELVEVLAGQRRPSAGSVEIEGQAYAATRAQMRALKVHCLPEEPLKNACVGDMSVAENLAFRDFDSRPFARGGWWIDASALRERARRTIERYGIKAQGPDAAVATLSGGNVQRTVLAREMAEEVAVLVVANPCFGLDFAAVAEVRGRVQAARDRGAAVLLVSEDLDEIFELADRVLVMFEGKIAHEAFVAETRPEILGRYMAGHAGR